MKSTFVVNTKSADGSPILPDVIYTIDNRGFPTWSSRRVERGGQVYIGEARSEPFGILMLWEVPNFGNVMVTADNEGSGYSAGSDPIDFRFEAAKSKALSVGNRLNALTNQRYEIADETKAKTMGAISKIRNARPSEVEILNAALSDLFWAGEEIELAKAGIDLSVMDDGRKKSLLFGSAYFDAGAPKEFNDKFSQLLNFATTPFYRARVEPKQGFLNWEPIDAALDWCEKMQIPAKGHPLFWMHRAGVPDWMHNLSFEDLKDVVYNQITQAVTRYKDRIKIWDVINEAHDPVEANVLDYSQEMRFELTALAAQAVKDADPKATRIVNVNRHFGYYRGEWETRQPLHPIEYLEELSARNIDYEVLGIQMYHGGIGHWVRDMADQSAMMDQFITFGKPIHITEVQSPSSMNPDLSGKRETFDPGQAGWWHKPWDPDTQADWVEQFYRIALSKSEIEAITWWSLSDRQTFWPSGGLLDAKDQPKPAYDRLLKLIQSLK